MGRSPCCDKANVKRGPWSPEEDATLRNYIEKQGTAGNWIALPHRAGLNRCGKSCRLRWLNYLRPDIKLGSFTEEEDSMIYSHYCSIGSRWSVIASKMPGRTDNDVKNHWNTKLKKKVLAGKFCLQNNTPTPVRRNFQVARNPFESFSKVKSVSDEFPNFSTPCSLEMDNSDSLWLGNWGVEEFANWFDLQYGPFLHEFGSEDNMHP